MDTQSEQISSWWQFFSGLQPEFQFSLVVVLISCLTVIVIVAVVLAFVAYWNISRHRAEVELKRELLDQGHTADEIATVIRATAEKRATRFGSYN